MQRRNKIGKTCPLVFLLLLTLSLSQLHAQCDGIIFTNDLGLVPDGGFEERDCCPDNYTFPGMEPACILSHIQASSATLDYHVVDCGSSLNQGCIPFIPPGTAINNGMIGMGVFTDWTEYLGTCLNGPLVPGITYLLKFKIGFGTPNSFCPSGMYIEAISPMNFSLFAPNDCSELPFFGSGCPASWWYLGTTSVSGQNEWVEGSIEFEVDAEKNSIVFGAECMNTEDLKAYYFLDDLSIVELTRLEVSTSLEVEGHPCTGVTLLAEDQTILSYQWFFNGNPIPGATTLDYEIPLGQEGDYFVRMYVDDQCVESDLFSYTVPLQQSDIQKEICFGESFAIGGEVFDQSGQYQLTLIDQFGCDSILTLDLLVRDQLSIDRQSQDHIRCAGDSVEVQLESNAQGPIYTWNDGTVSATRTLGPGNYEVSVVDDLGCHGDPHIFSLTNPESLFLEIATTDEPCPGDANGTATLEIIGGLPPYQYQWQGNDWQSSTSSLQLSNLSPADYSILIQDDNQCQQVANFNIQAREAVEVFIETTEPRADGNSAYLSVLSEPALHFESYSWTGPNLLCDDCPNPLLQPLPPIFSLYHVTLIEQVLGCRYEAQIEVKLRDGIYLSNAFSPNGDGANDYFFLQAHPGCVEEVISFNIYNRWGAFLFAQATPLPNMESQGWDGNFKGQPMPPGVYVYTARLRLITGEEVFKKGSVNLVR